jgi:hypothetical protein
MNTAEFKLQEALAELRTWFAQTDCKKKHFDINIQEIEQYIVNKGNPKSAFRPFDYLNTWYRNSFSLHSLEQDGLEDFFSLAQNSYFTLKLASASAQQFPGNPPNIGFHFPMFYLANIINSKWSKLAEEILDFLVEGLPTKFLKGGDSHKITAWYVLHISCKAFNKHLETGRFNYPKSMGVYEGVINDWDTEDLTKVDKMIDALCDYHLEQADFGTDKNNILIQFNSASEFVYAYEVLVWLSLREMKGLKNPKTYRHPLMQLPINKLPESTQDFKTTKFYDEIWAIIKNEFKFADAQVSR